MHALLHSVNATRPFVMPLPGSEPRKFHAQPTPAPDFDLTSLDGLVGARRRVKSGEPLYHAGDSFTSIYVVRSGFFRSTMTLEDGREQVTGFTMAGEIIGLDGIHTGSHSCGVTALEDSEACVISYARLQRLSANTPELQHCFHRLLGREIAREYKVMLLLGSMRAEERIATFLLNLSARYAARGYSATAFNLRMTRDDIGSYLGLKIETVSRALGKLQKLNYISVKGRRITIDDIGALQAFLRGDADVQPLPSPLAMCA